MKLRHHRHSFYDQFTVRRYSRAGGMVGVRNYWIGLRARGGALLGALPDWLI